MIRRLLHRILHRPGIQRHASPYVALEQQIVAAAALTPDALPIVVWSETHDPDDEDCMCRDCHRWSVLHEFSDEAIRHELADMVRHDPLLRHFEDTRVRRIRKAWPS